MMSKGYVVGMVTAVVVGVFAPACFAVGIERIAPMSIIPEPATGVLLAIGGLMMLPRRKRR